MADIGPVQVPLEMAGCKTHRKYLYVSDINKFLSASDLISYAKEGEVWGAL